MTTELTRPTRRRRRRIVGLGVAVVGLVAAGVPFAFRAGAAPIPRTGTEQGGIPANDSCGIDGLGIYVKFTVGGNDGDILNQQGEGNPGNQYHGDFNQNVAGGTFTVTDITRNGVPVMFDYLVGKQANDRDLWDIGAALGGPTFGPVVVSTTGGHNFTQFAICTYQVATLDLTKTVNLGSGTFTFTIRCVGPHGTLIVERTVSLTVSAGVPVTSSGVVTVPAGATCTATETGANPNTYSNDGPKTITLVPGTNSVTINNTLQTFGVNVVKTMVPSPLGPADTAATFVITVTNTGNQPATGVVVTDVVPAPLTVGVVVPPAPTTWSAPTWTIGTLAANSSVTLSIPVTVPIEVGRAYPPGPVVENCATLVVTSQDDTSDNRSCAPVLRVSNLSP